LLHNIHKDAFFLPFVMVRDEMSCSFTLTIPAQKDMLEQNWNRRSIQKKGREKL